MKLREFHERCVEIGMQADPRGEASLKRQLRDAKKAHDEARGKERMLFDEERLWNPFHDTRILSGDGGEELTTLFVGIDVSVWQILVADRLRERGERIDGILMHHPMGRAFAEMPNDMRLQAPMLEDLGVPPDRVGPPLEKEIARVARSKISENLFEWQKTADLLGFPGLCVHTPADSLAWRFLNREICKAGHRTLGSVVTALLKIEEVLQYAKGGLPPLIVNGDDRTPAGKIAAAEITGGTTGPASQVRELALAGVGTILSMHVSDENAKVAADCHVAMIQIPHFAADGLGMNLLLDELRKADPDLRFVAGCGFTRVER